ncbi:hypothetical protein [Streptomyces sp. NPDC059491]|uniref:hypothetical protein n=1 Tax=Streptomyces sp. NPDC059491 TaxID=3346850 RepID=UPI0036C4D838
MNWETLVATVLGAVVGVSSTLIVDRVRWRRDQATSSAVERRQLYGQFLGAVIATRMNLSELLRDEECLPDERGRRASNVLHSGGVYELRYQIMITAPAAVVAGVEESFQTLRGIRDQVAEGQAPGSTTYVQARERHRRATSKLTSAMREELSNHPGV